MIAIRRCIKTDAKAKIGELLKEISASNKRNSVCKGIIVRISDISDPALILIEQERRLQIICVTIRKLHAERLRRCL